ncbi:nuclear transport factor 2 family protein [Rhodococcus sp. NCIMB 12038]|uniref:nuclear transport factor 2 family protein n=1 Tax=Rhodococcus sp. NCIMB 12038 TaxID=933800 RepID=UPI00117A626C|nr:nuclear transport factor 2 family protein [Rhodococcus sp. NCIMB 12038]
MSTVGEGILARLYKELDAVGDGTGQGVMNLLAPNLRWEISTPTGTRSGCHAAFAEFLAQRIAQYSSASSHDLLHVSRIGNIETAVGVLTAHGGSSGESFIVATTIDSKNLVERLIVHRSNTVSFEPQRRNGPHAPIAASR